jgi:serine/threonine-protein kinase HSL1 (negative regulator of Swe1 kinase)
MENFHMHNRLQENSANTRSPLVDATIAVNNRHLEVENRDGNNKRRQREDGISQNHIGKENRYGNSRIQSSRPCGMGTICQEKKTIELRPPPPPDNSRNPLENMGNRSTIKISKNKKEHVGPWMLGKMLGKGTSGQVRLGKHERSGEYVAIKVLPKILLPGRAEYHENGDRIRQIGGSFSHGLEREVAVMKLMSHPNVIQLKEVWEGTSEV